MSGQVIFCFALGGDDNREMTERVHLEVKIRYNKKCKSVIATNQSDTVSNRVPCKRSHEKLDKSN